MLEQMLAFIRDNNICVLATTQGPQPHCSLMAYVPDDQGRRIYLITSADTLKYRNVLANSSVSLLIDDRQKVEKGAGLKALTVSGACSLAPEELQEELKARFAQSMPHLIGITADPAARVLEVKVRSLQLLAGPTQSSFAEIA